MKKNYDRNNYLPPDPAAVCKIRSHRSAVHRIYAECDPENTRSWKLLEKAGMRREAHLIKNVYFHTDDNGLPKWKDTYIYALLKSERMIE